MTDKITAVLGPTNTGKTHFAVERMLAHHSGMIGLPLRLLAREIYDRVVDLAGAPSAALITGEEKIIPPNPRFYVCTVEAMPLEIDVAFMGIDEIQLCADPERGHVFTDRLLHARGTEETMFMGAETMRPLIKQLLPDIAFISRPRYSDLTYSGPRKISRLPRRSAIVGFSSDSVYGIAELIRRQRGGAAVVMGALSPRTRNAQVALYQSGDVDFLVATDAIGMGLNMDIDHVAFANLKKFDGQMHRPLRPSEVAQIAGRAGRHMNDGTFGPTGEVGPMDPDLVSQIENHRFDPVKVLQWRSPNLDFSSVDGLLRSLEVLPPQKGLTRARAADDVLALKAMSKDPDITKYSTAPAAIKQLWEVCQIPDFRQTIPEEHVRLLTTIYLHLMEREGRIPPDWISGHLDKLDRTDGDLDTLATRIAHIRTWTFVSNRNGWLDDVKHWQERTRVIEDNLSDALHERLTQRFIDRRTSVLIKRLQQQEDLNAAVGGDGDVTVEDEYVGKLSGFHFVPDPRAFSGEEGLSLKTLRQVASQALSTEIMVRVARLSNVPDTAIQLTENGKLWWESSPVAQLLPGPDALSPTVQVICDDIVDERARARIQYRLDRWVKSHIAEHLAPLVKLRDAEQLEGAARGLAFRLVESMGACNRRQIADQVREIDQSARVGLRQLGVRFGEFSVFLPALLKPGPAHLKTLLWAVAQGYTADGQRLLNTLPPPPSPGLTSILIDKDVPTDFYEIAGFRICGHRAVRIDMLERLGDMIRPDGGKKRPPIKSGPETASEKASESENASDAKAEETNKVKTETSESAETDHSAHADVAGEDDKKSLSETVSPTDQDREGATQNVADEKPEGATDDKKDNAQQQKPSEPAEPDRKPGFVTSNAFIVVPDMMSLVGCSGDEFAEILRSLGYRASPHKNEDGEEVQLWQLRRTQRPQKQKRRRSQQNKGGRPAKEHRSTKPRQGGERSGPNRKRKERPIDPDNPFAALAALKDKKSGK